MKKIYIALILGLISISFNAQINNIITAPPVNQANGTTGLRAPNGNASHTTMRACYFVPASELTALTNSITSFGFVLTNTLASAPATGTLTVYLQNTSASTYTLGTDYTAAIAPMTQVYTGTYNIPTGTVATVVDFLFPTSFTYTPSSSLFLAYEYKGGQFAPNTAIYSAYSNTSITAGATNATSFSLAANTLSTTTFRPLFRFGTPNPITNDVVLRIVNAPGKVSQTTGTQHTITANVFNGSNTTLNNISVDLTITGSNTFTANTVVPSLAAGAVTTVVFPAYNPTVLGISNIGVTVPNDQNNANNAVSFTQSVTCNVMATGPASFAPTSYSSGVGFNTGSGIIYSKFSTAATQTLIGVDLAISSGISNIGNSVYGVVCNSVGLILSTTNTLLISANELNTIQTFIFNSTVFNPNQIYYVGMAQTANSIGYYPLGATPAPFTPTLYVTQPISGGALTPLNSNLGFFGIEPFFTSPCNGVGLTKLNNHFNFNMNLYPNPARDKVTIFVSNVTSSMKLKVYNAIGALVLEQNSLQEENELIMQQLDAGVYFIKLIDGKSVQTKKLIIQ